MVTIPEEEADAKAYFLADYVLKHLDKAELVLVSEHTGAFKHTCESQLHPQVTYIDIILDMPGECIDEYWDYPITIKELVAEKLATFSFIFDGQMHCLHEQFYTIEYHEEEPNEARKTGTFN
jgi:hypothetical protein